MVQAPNLHIAGVALKARGVYAGQTSDQIGGIASNAAESIGRNNVLHSFRQPLQGDGLGQTFALAGHDEFVHAINIGGQTHVAAVGHPGRNRHRNVGRAQTGIGHAHHDVAGREVFKAIDSLGVGGGLHVGGLNCHTGPLQGSARRGVCDGASQGFGDGRTCDKTGEK